MLSVCVATVSAVRQCVFVPVLILVSTIILSVICHNEWYYNVCGYADSHSVLYHYAECMSCYNECCYYVCHYAECHSGLYHYAGCVGL
jgi:hypothetical protein